METLPYFEGDYTVTEAENQLGLLEKFVLARNRIRQDGREGQFNRCLVFGEVIFRVGIGQRLAASLGKCV